MRRTFGLGALALSVGFLSGCDSDNGTPPPVVTTINVSPTAGTLEYVGSTLQFSATVLDQDGKVIPGVDLNWSSTAPAVASVNASSGLVTAEGAGTATIRASAEGKSGSASVSVELRACDAPVPVNLSPGEFFEITAAELEGCGLQVPSGQSGDYYRFGVIWPERNNNNTVTPTVALSVNGPGVVPSLVSEPLAVAWDQATRSRLEIPESFWNAVRIQENTSRYHDALRAREEVLLASLGPDARVLPDLSSYVAQSGGPLAVAPDRWEYDSDTDGCETAGELRVAQLVGQNDLMAIYQDSIQRGTEPVRTDIVTQMLSYYQDHGKEVIDEYFGGVSDINGDGQIRVIVSPSVSSNIAAFVWSGDMLPKEDCAQSNEMELIFFSAGTINNVEDGDYQALTTLVHEAKHVSSLYKRIAVALSGGQFAGFHPSWIEEGTAEIAAELAARISWERDGGPAVGAKVVEQDFRNSEDVFNANNYGIALRLARAVTFLSHQPNSVVRTIGGSTVYGSGWHFHRYLGDQYGNAEVARSDAALFTAQNDSLAVPGVEGFPSLVGKSYETLYREFARVVMSHGFSNLNPEFDFTTYDFADAAEVFCNPNPLGTYPWPTTANGTSGACGGNPETSTNYRSFVTAEYSGQLGASGIRVYDFRSNGTGTGAEFSFDFSSNVAARILVLRVN